MPTIKQNQPTYPPVPEVHVVDFGVVEQEFLKGFSEDPKPTKKKVKVVPSSLPPNPFVDQPIESTELASVDPSDQSIPEEELVKLIEQFTAYTPQIRQASVNGRGDYVFVFKNRSRRVRIDPAYCETVRLSDGYGVLGPWETRFDANTLVQPATGEKLTITPLAWQIEQGLHPVLPKVANFFGFLCQWLERCITEESSVYTGTPVLEKKTFRFCLGVRMRVPSPALETYTETVHCRQNRRREGARQDSYYIFKERYRAEQTVVVTDPLTVPQVSEEKREGLVLKAMELHHPLSSFVVDCPTALEFEDNTEMIKRVEEHCKGVPEFKIHYLRRQAIAYITDGNLCDHPAAFDFVEEGQTPKYLYRKTLPNDPAETWVVCTEEEAQPTDYKYPQDGILYCGTAWALSCSMFDKYVCANNLIYFTTWEEFEATYQRYRPDQLQGVPRFSDLPFLCSHWCERNSAKNYPQFIELQTPVDRQLSLANWLTGPFLFNKQHDTKLPGVVSHRGDQTMKRLQLLKQANLNRQKVGDQPRMNPAWASALDHVLTIDEEIEARRKAKLGAPVL